MTSRPPVALLTSFVVPVLLRAAAVVGSWVLLGAVLHRGSSAAERGVDIGGGLARVAAVLLVVAVGAAVDARRRGFAVSVRTWVTTLAVLAVGALVSAVLPAVTGAPSAEPLGTVLMAVVAVVAILLVPAGALAVAAAALADRRRATPAG